MPQVIGIIVVVAIAVIVGKIFSKDIQKTLLTKSSPRAITHTYKKETIKIMNNGVETSYDLSDPTQKAAYQAYLAANPKIAEAFEKMGHDADPLPVDMLPSSSTSSSPTDAPLFNEPDDGDGPIYKIPK